MKSKWCWGLLALMAWLAGGCSDELLTGQTADDFEEGELVEVSLSLSVKGLQVELQADTKARVEDTEAERAIHDIWVCQFEAASGKRLTKPRYYTIDDQSQLKDLPVYLRPNEAGEESVVYIVANTGRADWLNGREVGGLDNFGEQTVFNLEPQFVNDGEETLSIPMEGSAEAEVSAESVITVPVTRMFAKLNVRVEIGEDLADRMTLRSIEINSISKVSLVRARTGEEGDKTIGEKGNMEYWTTRAFGSADDPVSAGTTYTIYVAENMQGGVRAIGAEEEVAPVNALRLGVQAALQTEQGATQQSNYYAYPGTDTDDDQFPNDYNIRRNCVYNVVVTIREGGAELHIPSSNCFIVEPGKLLSFEPYYRVETGGGFKIEDYLNPDEPEKAIDKVKILWQTEGAIGDNSDGSLVWYEPDEKKIYVRTAKEGNALIAAYNTNEEIIWSWHIWVTGNDPGNLSKAIRYYTYRWDEKGIYGVASGEPRISGYQVMSCNLGALADTPTHGWDTKPFGMLYQWGRKDPFPPLRTKGGHYSTEYTPETTERLYDNANQPTVGMTSSDDETQLFHSCPGDDIRNMENPIYYAIQHPTVFMCGTNQADRDEDYVKVSGNYFAQGDWTHQHNDELWGGLKPRDDGTMKKYSYNTDPNGPHIYDNYGTEKSIFDPCPSGWRVPPGELWLGFTIDGRNPGGYYQTNINLNPDIEGWDWDRRGTLDPVYTGMYIYMQAWKTGVYSYFPNQGPRVGDGRGIRVGRCGNYHNATTDINNRVNILHTHNNAAFMIFETTNYMYYVKSVAGPIRCVRDRL